MNLIALLKQKWRGTLEFKDQYGWKKTFVVIKRIIFKQPFDDVVSGVQPMAYSTRKKKKKIKTVSEMLDARFRNQQAISSVHIDENVKRLNLVTDSIESNSLLGGVATALIVATEFARKNDMILRIITRNAPTNPMNYKNIIELSGLDPYDKLEFYSDYDREDNGRNKYALDVSPTDVFFATSWWSAEAITKTTIRKRFFYIIQEVETFFYPHGEEHYMCSKIMEKKNVDFIINSQYLYEYFDNNKKNIVENGVFFDPAFDKNMYHTGDFSSKDKYKLFFYARPNNPRNMFYYGLHLIDYAIKTGVLDTNEWEICCAGQDIPRIVFSNGYEAVDMGLMKWEKYCKFLTTVDLAVSLMYTPHPSYPPYDVACSGGVVLTNQCLNKTSFNECNNILMADLDEEKFANKMREAIELAKNMELRKSNYEKSTIPRNWVETLVPVMSYMQERVKDVQY
ncbi:MAG: hypothetical protein K6G45_02810 [Lachnospiraceae bacterium]|nr:hypothetical protein [Lachnospiraceae bacterium]